MKSAMGAVTALIRRGTGAFQPNAMWGIEAAQRLHMIDLDASLYVEYDDRTREPIALIETARDVGQTIKTATVTQRLAARAGLCAYVLLYTVSGVKNPADPNTKDIDAFRYRRLWPRPEANWHQCSPEEWAKSLLRLRSICAKEVDDLIENDHAIIQNYSAWGAAGNRGCH